MSIEVLALPPAPRPFTSPADLAWFDTIAGERNAVHVSGDASGGALTLMESVAAPGTATPIHVHAQEHETFFVLEGVLSVFVAGEVLDLTPGASVSVPAGTAHGWRNRGAMPVRFLATFVPGGLDRMFQQFAGRDLPGLIRIAERFGTRVVGPPME